MKKMPDINPDSQDIAELQAMVKALMAEKASLLEQFKLAIDRQFAKRSESLKPYDDAQGDLFNEAECEVDAASDEQEVVTTTTTKKVRGKRKPLPKDLPREHIVLDLDDDEKVCSCCQHPLHKIGEDSCEKLEFTPAVLKVLEYVRPKYSCRQCEKEADKVSIS
ncbi:MULTISPECIES: IS66 family transposase, partial [Vibrio]